MDRQEIIRKITDSYSPDFFDFIEENIEHLMEGFCFERKDEFEEFCKKEYEEW